MKRYMVFGGPDYYPSGGITDFLGTFDCLESARLATRGRDFYGHLGAIDWWQIFDTTTQSVVEVSTDTMWTVDTMNAYIKKLGE